MPKYSNISSVPLSMAVFLATDHYDHDDATISVTTLIKPLRQVILGARIPVGDASVELVQMTASRMGTAIHDGIERAWLNHYRTAMTALGYPNKVIDRIIINPAPGELRDDHIPIYLERRSKKQVGKHLVSGKFDFVGEGRLEDFKSTSVYSYISNCNDDKHALQGSIYRWLNQDIITQDDMAIQYIFTDWSAARARSEANYPPQRIHQRILPLKSVSETQAYVEAKLAQIDQFWEAPEGQLPLCSDEDLWRSDPVFKYYKNPEKTARSTKNFDNVHDARLKLIEDGNVGIVKEVPGQVTACKYCNAFSICSQKDTLIANGDLIL